MLFGMLAFGSELEPIKNRISSVCRESTRRRMHSLHRRETHPSRWDSPT